MNCRVQQEVTTFSPTLVFLHGWGSDSRVWENLQQALPGQHLNLDLPGFGGNNERALQLQEYLERCVQILPKHCVLIGWSLGGMLAVRLASMAADKVVGLVTLASNTAFVATETWPDAMAPDTYQQFINDFAQNPERTFKRFCTLQSQGESEPRAVIQALKQFAPNERNNAQWLAALAWLEEANNQTVMTKLQLPQLHLFGQQDALVPYNVVDNLTQSAQAKCVVIEAASHCLPLAHAPRCAALINHFLQDLQGISKQKIAQSFGAAAATYDDAAQIQKVVGQRLLNKITEPLTGRWLDLGAGTGYLRGHLKSEFHPDSWINGDIAFEMLSHAQAATKK